MNKITLSGTILVIGLGCCLYLFMSNEADKAATLLPIVLVISWLT